jgi:hypothetical protein|tara:strand:+ start:361 stop:621 length:261 start_codon:yes stop_codon:yes gene_type:complete
MKFNVTAKQVLRYEIKVEREFSVDVTKKQVVDAGLCGNSEDGDSSAWKGYVDQLLEENGTQAYKPSKAIGTNMSIVYEKILNVDWN